MCELWNKKQSMLVSRKHFVVGKKRGASECHLCVVCVRSELVGMAKTRAKMVGKVLLRPCVHHLLELVVHPVVEVVAVEERADDVGEKHRVHTVMPSCAAPRRPVPRAAACGHRRVS